MTSTFEPFPKWAAGAKYYFQNLNPIESGRSK